LTRVFAAVVLFAVGPAGPAIAHGRFPTFGAFGIAPATTTSKRVVYYYQTQYDGPRYISLQPMWARLNPHTGKPAVTDMMIAAVHLGTNPNGSPYIHINDNVPQDPMFDQMWREVATLQGHGVTARFMLGGAAQGSYADLFAKRNVYYPIIRNALLRYHLNGIDLDVEEQVSLANIEWLIAQLRHDFGSGFIITLSPVATALNGGGGLSGFDYTQLYKSTVGRDIAWFNAQFYSGFGDLSTPADYESIVAFGFPPDKVVAGMLDNPNDGSGYVPVAQVAQTVHTLAQLYPSFGGVAGWEYFDALPGGKPAPIDWASLMSNAMQ